MSVEMSVPKVGIHRLIDAGRSLQKIKTDHVSAQARQEIKGKVTLFAHTKNECMWTIGFVQGIPWFGDNPCRKYTENQGICDRKKLRKLLCIKSLSLYQ